MEPDCRRNAIFHIKSDWRYLFKMEMNKFKHPWTTNLCQLFCMHIINQLIEILRLLSWNVITFWTWELSKKKKTSTVPYAMQRRNFQRLYLVFWVIKNFLFKILHTSQHEEVQSSLLWSDHGWVQRDDYHDITIMYRWSGF